MLIDSGLATELGTPQGAQTLAFVMKIMAGLFYVDINSTGSDLTCQVKTGDGRNSAGVHNIMIQIAATDTSVPPAPPILPSISVTVGTLKAGSGTNFWAQTNTDGALSITVTGIGSILVEMTPNQGVATSIGIG